jgi:hypothetical protein
MNRLFLLGSSIISISVFGFIYNKYFKSDNFISKYTINLLPLPNYFKNNQDIEPIEVSTPKIDST